MCSLCIHWTNLYVMWFTGTVLYIINLLGLFYNLFGLTLMLYDLYLIVAKFTHTYLPTHTSPLYKGMGDKWVKVKIKWVINRWQRMKFNLNGLHNIAYGYSLKTH